MAKQKLSLPSLWHIAALLVLIAVILTVYVILTYYPHLFSAEGARETAEQIGSRYGIIGIFVFTLIANATLVFPIPADLVIFAISVMRFEFGFGVLNPFVLGLVAGIASAIGELVTYIAGFLGGEGIYKAFKKDISDINRVKEKMNKYGFFLISITAFTPIPFELVGITAGLMKYNLHKFFIATLVGKIARCVLIAYAGYFGSEILMQFLMQFFGLSI